jgi:hypothetical protein
MKSQNLPGAQTKAPGSLSRRSFVRLAGMTAAAAAAPVSFYFIGQLLSKKPLVPPAKILTPADTNAQLVLAFLKQLAEPEFSAPIADGLTEVLTKAITAGQLQIKIITPPPGLPHNQRGGYNPQTNTLTMFFRAVSPNLDLAQKEFLAHELYHAYQDIKMVPILTKSRLEGQAYLFATRLVLISLGYTMPSAEAARALKRFGVETNDWFMGFNENRLAELTAAALTNDRKEWEKAANAFGITFGKQLMLAKLDMSLKNIHDQKDKTALVTGLKITAKAGSESFVIEIPPVELNNLYNLRLKTFQTQSNEEYAAAFSKLLDYWLDNVSWRFARYSEKRDSLLNAPDGI